MNTLAILGYNVTIGLPEMIIFLLAAIVLGFSLHFFWNRKKLVPDFKSSLPVDDTHISEEDQNRLQLYEEIEKHEKIQERLQNELKRMSDTEKSLLRELEETREEVSRLEKSAEKKIVTEATPQQPARQFSELLIAQQHLNESLSKEMTERLEKAYEEFNFLQDRITKLHSQVIDPSKRNFEFDELEQSYFRLTKEYDELKIRHLHLMDENQRLTRAFTDTEERLRDSNFQKQQLNKKVMFLEELANDLQQLSGHHKKLEGQLRRINEIETLLNRAAQEKRS
jgi:hypothetical protein